MNCMKFFKYFIIDYRNVLRVQSLFCWRREDLKGIQPCFFSFKSIIENPKMKVRIFCIKISTSGVSLFIHQSLFFIAELYTIFLGVDKYNKVILHPIYKTCS